MAVFSELITLIVYVVVIIAVFKAAQRRKKALHPDNILERLNAQNGTPNRSGAQSYGTTSNYQSASSQAGGMAYKPADVSATPVGSVVTAAPKKAAVPTTSKSFANTASASNAADTQTKKSTTDYLQEKARLDQVEHAKEKLAEDKRVSQKYGGRRTAMRYLIGDPVPNGSQLFICPYCGAENLVPASYHRDLNCYFCRTHLK